MSENPIKEKKLIHNYMFIREIEKTDKRKRLLAEDMRFSREVWIDIYPKSQDSAASLEELKPLKQIAEKIKQSNTGEFTTIFDLIDTYEAFFIVMEPPKGRPCSQLSPSDENTLKAIGSEIIRLLIWLQNHDFGIDHLSPNEIYFTDQTQKIQFLFNDRICIRPSQESRKEEIKCVGELFYYLSTGEVWIEGTDLEKKVEGLKQKALGDLISTILLDKETNKNQKLETLLSLMGVRPTLPKKDEKELMEMLAQEETPPSKQIFRLFLIFIITVLFYFEFVQMETEKLQNTSTFDVIRFKIMGYLEVQNAQRVLGEIYEKGIGTEIDLKESFFWYKKAAQSGNIYAQMSLGHFYDRGIGVAIDKKQALYWFTLAAANGDETAQKNVQIMQENGEIPKINPVNSSTTPLEIEKASDSKPDVIVQTSLPSENTMRDGIETKRPEAFQPIPIVSPQSVPIKTQETQQTVKKSSQAYIMWQDNEDVVRVKRSWKEAIGYCENLHLNGYSDWALPDKDMLFDLFFEEPDLQFVANDLYWTSSEVSSDKAWRIYFDYSGGKNRQGNMTNNSKNDEWYVRCYRKL